MMRTKDYPFPNATPFLIQETDVLGQIKPRGITVLKRFKHHVLNAPDLNVTYAGLGIRLLAAIIDMMILLCALLLLETIFSSFKYTYNDFNGFRLFICIFTWLFYNVLFECSVYQATIGEMVLKLKVVDLYGKRMSVLRSFFRGITAIISILPVGIGLWYLTTDAKKRTWHDMIAGTYVIKS
jgi:uncharacterized RDD family membrane protein YckC